MAGKSDYLENKILDLLFSNTAYSIPGTLYIALFTSPPTDAGGGTEVVGGSYARVAVTNNVGNWPAASAGVKSNGNAITFVQATAVWGTVTAIAIMDALTSGNMLFWGSLSVNRTINIGDQFSFSPGQLQITED